MTQLNNSFEVNHIDLYKYPTVNKTVSNVQPPQSWLHVYFQLYHILKKLQFLKKFHVQYFDVRRSQYI